MLAACAEGGESQECGDGKLDAGEECDEGDANGAGLGYCQSGCSGVEVPEGMVWVSAGEYLYGAGGGGDSLLMQGGAVGHVCRLRRIL